MINIFCAGWGGEGGNLKVILVRVCGPVFLNLPQSYTWSSKKNDIFILFFDFISPLCCL